MDVDLPQMFIDFGLVAPIFIWNSLFCLLVVLCTEARTQVVWGRWGVFTGGLCEAMFFWVLSLGDWELRPRWGVVVEWTQSPGSQTFHLRQLCSLLLLGHKRLSHLLPFHFLLVLLSVWKFSITLVSALLLSAPTFLLSLWPSTAFQHWDLLGRFRNYWNLCPTARPPLPAPQGSWFILSVEQCGHWNFFKVPQPMVIYSHNC